MNLHEDLVDLYWEHMNWKDDPVNWDDLTVVTEILDTYISAFKQVSPRLRNHRALVEKVLRKSGAQLLYVSESLRDDPSIVNIAVSQRICALEYASDRLRNDIEFVTSILKVHSCGFRYIGDQLKENRNLVEWVVRRHGAQIQYTKFRDDDLLVQLALTRPDKELDCSGCEACCLEELDLNVLCYASNRLQNSLIELAIEYDYEVCFIGDLADNPELIEKGVRKQAHALKKASDRLKQDRNFIKNLVSIRGSCLQYVNKEFTDDLEIVMCAFNQDPEALNYASENLQRTLDHLIVAPF